MQMQVLFSIASKHLQRLTLSLRACKDCACKKSMIIKEEKTKQNKNKTMNRHTLVFDWMITVPSGMLKGVLGQVNSNERQQDPHQAKCDSLQTSNK